jgi:hypothetical protein
MTPLFAQRLHALGEHVNAEGVDRCEAILRSGDGSAIDDLLSPVNGIGPVVLERFHLLRGSP